MSNIFIRENKFPQKLIPLWYTEWASVQAQNNNLTIVTSKKLLKMSNSHNVNQGFTVWLSLNLSKILLPS